MPLNEHIALTRASEVIEATAHRHGPVTLQAEQARTLAACTVSMLMALEEMARIGVMPLLARLHTDVAALEVLRLLGYTDDDVRALLLAVRADMPR